jgi:hypothetical protein
MTSYDHSEFRAASEAAERWADQIAAFCYWADLSLPDGSDMSQGERTRLAREKLTELKDEYSRHGPALDPFPASLPTMQGDTPQYC